MPVAGTTKIDGDAGQVGTTTLRSRPKTSIVLTLLQLCAMLDSGHTRSFVDALLFVS